MVEHASNPQGFSRTWQHFSYVFDLPDPSSYPRLDTVRSDPDLASAARFVATCAELAGYTIFSSRGGLTVSQDAAGETKIDSSLPSSETVRGATVLFRQLYGADSGSYSVVNRILGRAVAEQKDENYDRRMDELKTWRRAHAILQQATLRALVHRRHAEVPLSTQLGVEGPWDSNPRELIEQFLYGELVHWGSRKEEHASLMKRPVIREFSQIEFLDVVTSMSHFYFGYSLLLARAFSAQLS